MKDMTTTTSEIRGRRLVWGDSFGGLVAGTIGWVVSGWLSSFYGLPVTLMRVIATVNLLYGMYSLVLALSPVRSRKRVLFLIGSNFFWVGVCSVLAVVYWPTANVFGVGHLIVEGAIVGAIACVEWRYRDLMITK